MPLLLPPYADENLTPGEKTFLNRMKRIYENRDRDANLYVQPRIGQLEPDFVLIDPFKGVLVVEVKDWSLNYIRSSNQRVTQLSDGRQSRNPAFRCNQYLRNLERLLRTDLRLVTNGILNFPIFAKVFFPNLSAGELNDRSDLRNILDQHPVTLLTKDAFRDSDPDRLFGPETLRLREEDIHRIRALLFPEVIITGMDFQHAERNELTTLSNIQENLYKKSIYGHYLSTGIPGSGKTKILLARALYLARAKPTWKILILTYTNSLASKLRQQLRNHDLGRQRINEEANLEGENLAEVGIDRELIEGAFSRFGLRLENSPPRELAEYVKSKSTGETQHRLLTDEELLEDTVAELHELSESVSQQDPNVIDEFLLRSNRHLWTRNIEVSTFSSFAKSLSDIETPHDLEPGAEKDEWFNITMPRAALQNATPRYDAVLVDEYQDFRDDWFRLCKKVCRAHSDGAGNIVESLWFAGDQLQSIYVEKPQSWSSVGLSVRGRSTFIKKTYRASSSHIALALAWLQSEPQIKDEAEKFYPEDGYSHNDQRRDEIEFTTGDYASLGQKVQELLNEYNPNDILILCPYRRDCTTIFEALPTHVQEQTNATFDLELDDSIILTTYFSSKGLESKVAVLADVNEVAHINFVTPIIRKKLLYVGLTRASEKLVIHSQNDEGAYYMNLNSLMEDLEGA